MNSNRGFIHTPQLQARTPEDWLSDYLKINSHSINLGLDNITQAANLLDLSKPAPSVITVAGTNGKGSVVKLLELLLKNLGFRVGCYTSPHLINFNERISINCTNINNNEIIDSFVRIAELLQEKNLSLTYFEYTTLAAWEIFQNKQLDFVILEVGLGGRLDATNIIPKDLAIITAVDFDHQNFLGDTLELIGYEKAGIIEANKPVILGDVQMPESVYSVAKNCHATVYQYGVDYSLTEKLLINNNIDLKYFDINNLEIDRSANSNIKSNNIATSLMALSLLLNNKNLGEFNIDFKRVVSGTVADFNLIGRCQWLNVEKTILVDVAHNIQAISNLHDFLQVYCKANQIKKIIGVCGMLKDKDIKNCLKIMDTIVTDWHFTDINEPRGARARDLVLELQEVNRLSDYSVYPDILSCYKSASDIIKQNPDNDIILIVFGSFHVVGPVCNYSYSM